MLLENNGIDPRSEDIGFMAVEFVQCTLPHSDPGLVPIWVRRNGHFALTLEPGACSESGRSFGLPYGPIPRLLIAWITRECLRFKSRKIDLNSSLSQFLMELGLSSYTGRGPRGDATRLRDQMERFFRCRIGFDYVLRDGQRQGQLLMQMNVVDELQTWWTDRDSERSLLSGADNYIFLSERFFRAIQSHAVPLDMRVLKSIKTSSLAMDLYMILSREAFRAMTSGEDRFIKWQWLWQQTGNHFTHIKDFRRSCIPMILRILELQPSLNIVLQRGCKGKPSGLMISRFSEPGVRTRFDLNF